MRSKVPQLIGIFYSCQFLSWTSYHIWKDLSKVFKMSFRTFVYTLVKVLALMRFWISPCPKREMNFCNHKDEALKLKIDFWVFLQYLIPSFFSFWNRSHIGREKTKWSCQLIFPSHFLWGFGSWFWMTSELLFSSSNALD